MTFVAWFLAGVATSLAGGLVYLAQGNLPLALLAGVLVLGVSARRLA